MNRIQMHINTDSQGYLLHFHDWNEQIAIKIATLEGIRLEFIHWEIIYFVRMFYKEYNIAPNIRMLINILALKYGSNKGSSRYLAQLFPKKSAAQQISKISGLPKPKKCL